MADELGPPVQPLKTTESGLPIGTGVRPPVDAIVVTMADKSAPKSSDGIIVQTNEVAGY
jgi:hypothetical protein